jgi:hypothetical protein
MSVRKGCFKPVLAHSDVEIKGAVAAPFIFVFFSINDVFGNNFTINHCLNILVKTPYSQALLFRKTHKEYLHGT